MKVSRAGVSRGIQQCCAHNSEEGLAGDAAELDSSKGSTFVEHNIDDREITFAIGHRIAAALEVTHWKGVSSWANTANEAGKSVRWGQLFKLLLAGRIMNNVFGSGVIALQG